tara:strand:- start:408 stop:674 length:267 start_codon:yes stop_codon:yes gene_type:complete
MSKKELSKNKKGPLGLIEEIGPFEKAKNNAQKFAWNVTIAHAIQVALQSIDSVEGLETKEAEVTRRTAEIALESICLLLHDRDGGQWN